MTSPAKFLFLDLETTGLDTTCESILEVGCVLTTGRLEEMDQWSCVVMANPSQLDGMAPNVREMHTVNGLLAQVAKARLSVRDAEHRLLHLLQHFHGVEPGVLCLAGFGIGFDQRFIKAHMPKLAAFLHYRILDVRSVQYAVEAITGVAMLPQATKPHRALPDAVAALEELRRIGSKHIVADAQRSFP